MLQYSTESNLRNSLAFEDDPARPQGIFRRNISPIRLTALTACLFILLSLVLSPGVLQRICSRSAAPALLFIFFLTSVGCGARVLTLLNYKTHRKLEQFCLAFSIGWASLSVGLLLLSVLGWYRPAVFLPLSFLCFLCFGLGADGNRSGWDVLEAVRWKRLLRLYQKKRYRFVPFLLTVAVIIVGFFWAAGPVWDWDSEMYQLPNAQFFLAEHGLAPGYETPVRNVPGQAHLWYGIGLSLNQAAFSALLMWMAAVMTSLLAACYAARWIGTHTALWVPLVYWSGVIIVSVSTTSRVEPFYSLMFLTALAVLHPALFKMKKLDWKTVLLAGLCLGIAAGVKYQGLYGWVILAGLICWRFLFDAKLRTRQTVVAGCCLFIVAIVVMSPWWMKNLSAWGTPFYPMFDRSHVDSASLTHSNPHIPVREKTDWYLLSDGFRLLSHPNKFSGPPNQFPHYLFLLLPCLFVIRKQRTVALVVGLGLGYYALAFSLSTMHRHLFGLFALWSIGVAYALTYFETRKKWTVFFPGLVVLALLFALLQPLRLIRTPKLVKYLAGATDETELLSSIARDFHPAVEWINTHTPKDACILMCWDAREFRLNRKTIVDPGWFTWNMLFQESRQHPEEIATYLEQQKIDYLLVNEGALHFNVHQSERISDQSLKEFERQRDLLVGSVLQPVKSGNSVTVYKVIGQKTNLDSDNLARTQ